VTPETLEFELFMDEKRADVAGLIFKRFGDLKWLVDGEEKKLSDTAAYKAFVCPKVEKPRSHSPFINSLREPETELEALRKIRQEALRKALEGISVVGQEEAATLLLGGLVAGKHCLLIGEPGTAKTQLCRELQEAVVPPHVVTPPKKLGHSEEKWRKLLTGLFLLACPEEELSEENVKEWAAAFAQQEVPLCDAQTVLMLSLQELDRIFKFKLGPCLRLHAMGKVLEQMTGDAIFHITLHAESRLSDLAGSYSVKTMTETGGLEFFGTHNIRKCVLAILDEGDKTSRELWSALIKFLDRTGFVTWVLGNRLLPVSPAVERLLLRVYTKSLTPQQLHEVTYGLKRRRNNKKSKPDQWVYDFYFGDDIKYANLRKEDAKKDVEDMTTLDMRDQVDDILDKLDRIVGEVSVRRRRIAMEVVCSFVKGDNRQNCQLWDFRLLVFLIWNQGDELDDPAKVTKHDKDNVETAKALFMKEKAFEPDPTMLRGCWFKHAINW
jgi:hypothetical protein